MTTLWERFVGATLVVACGAAALVGCSSSKSAAVATTTTSATAAASADILAAPIQVASTAAGSVGYREVGSGTPLVLITGLSATMDDWAPPFVDALAAHHRVVVFDNAGIGSTAALGSPLTITKMADQTSALITTLGLGRSDVLGWSMGGMIAQALAVRHPGQVRRLILAATQPGTGTATAIPVAAAAAAVSLDVTIRLSVLFPAGQANAARAYIAEILQYPNRYEAPTAVIPAQASAVEAWLAGSDPAGPRLASVGASTLVADGTADALNPVANDQLLATTIPGAQITLYRDAGHAFLFQDTVAFVARIDRFLA